MSTIPLYIIAALFLLLIFLIVWLVFGELRTKAVKLKVENDAIIQKRFLGFGLEKKYYFKEFDGYKISILSSEYQEYEYLYLLIDGKKVIKLSQFYHSNYSELKQGIVTKTKNWGRLNYNILNEIKEIFAR